MRWTCCSLSPIRSSGSATSLKALVRKVNSHFCMDDIAHPEKCAPVMKNQVTCCRGGKQRTAFGILGGVGDKAQFGVAGEALHGAGYFVVQSAQDAIVDRVEIPNVGHTAERGDRKTREVHECECASVLGNIITSDQAPSSFMHIVCVCGIA